MVDEPSAGTLDVAAVCQWRECEEPAGAPVPYAAQLGPYLRTAPEPVPSSVVSESADGLLQIRLCDGHADAWAAMQDVSEAADPPVDATLETPLD